MSIIFRNSLLNFKLVIQEIVAGERFETVETEITTLQIRIKHEEVTCMRP
jgi:hypothetical protein